MKSSWDIFSHLFIVLICTHSSNGILSSGEGGHAVEETSAQVHGKWYKVILKSIFD